MLFVAFGCLGRNFRWWISYLLTFIKTLEDEGNRRQWGAQLGERRSAVQEVAGSNPGRNNTQGL